jgi:outer membrane scaffolding protein for murein synthesis (MipA/OmpV family)
MPAATSGHNHPGQAGSRHDLPLGNTMLANVSMSARARRVPQRVCSGSCAGWIFCILVLCTTKPAHADAVAPSAVEPSEAEVPPLWEAGVGVIAGLIADYPGSDHYRVRGLPIPYFIYRGDFFRADQSGTRLRAGSGNIEWEFSAGGTLSSNSQSGARAGMPKLDYLLEAGPKAKITVARPTPNSRVLIDLPLRAAASTDFSSRFRPRGFTFSPDITYEDQALLGSRWNGRVSLGIEFATQSLQEFYYGVAPQYAETGRPAYQAHGGYLGSDIAVTAFRTLRRNFHVFVAVDFDSYHGAASEQSPLFRTRGGVGAAVGFAWSFKQSKQSAGREYPSAH